MFSKDEVSSKAISSTTGKSELRCKPTEQQLPNGSFKHKVVDNIEDDALEIMDEGLYKYIGIISDHFQIVILLSNIQKSRNFLKIEAQLSLFLITSGKASQNIIR